MKNIIKGINVLEQIPIKEYATISKGKVIWLKDLGTKYFLFFYILWLAMAIFSVTHFSYFYVETGR